MLARSRDGARPRRACRAERDYADARGADRFAVQDARDLAGEARALAGVTIPEGLESARGGRARHARTAGRGNQDHARARVERTPPRSSRFATWPCPGPRRTMAPSRPTSATRGTRSPPARELRVRRSVHGAAPIARLLAAIRADLPAWSSDATYGGLIHLARWARVYSHLAALHAAGLAIARRCSTVSLHP